MVALAPLDLAPTLQQQVFDTLKRNNVPPLTWPHITLFQFPDTFSVPEIDRATTKIAANISPFQLEIDGAATFNNKKVAYLRVKKSRRLSQLRRQIIRIATRNPLETMILDWLWTPHITIAYQHPAFKAISADEFDG